MHGYIKLHRKMLDWEWHSDPGTFSVFMHLLLMARFDEGQWKGVRLEPGQLITGRKALSQSTGISEQGIRTCLERLKSTNEITIKSTNKFSVITIVNWGKYQCMTEEPTSKSTSSPADEQPAINQQSTNNQPQRKNDKNIKNESLLRAGEKNNDGFLTEEEMDGMREQQQELDQCYDQLTAIGLSTESDRRKCDQLAVEYTAEWLTEAVRRAGDGPQSAHSWRYIKAILGNFKQSGGTNDSPDRKPIPQKTAAQLREEARSERILRGEYDQPAHV
jgi:hypothetical protein